MVAGVGGLFRYFNVICQLDVQSFRYIKVVLNFYFIRIIWIFFLDNQFFPKSLMSIIG